MKYELIAYLIILSSINTTINSAHRELAKLHGIKNAYKEAREKVKEATQILNTKKSQWNVSQDITNITVAIEELRMVRRNINRQYKKYNDQSTEFFNNNIHHIIARSGGSSNRVPQTN